MMKKNEEDKLLAGEERKELTAEEKEILKKLEKGEVELDSDTSGSKAKGGKPATKVDPKYDIYTKMFYEVHPTIGLIYKNKAVISEQRKVIFYMLKKIGANLLHGRSIMNTSLPVTIFCPASLLEKSAESYVFAPLFFEKMFLATDPVEKMKQAVGFLVSSLHINLDQKKPFNPILGETFQGKIGDLDVYCEQTTHHPPVSQVLIVGEHFTISTKHQFLMNTYPNSATFKVLGKRKLTLNDSNHTRYTIEFPTTEIKGGMFGDRIVNYTGSVQITDKTNKLYAQLRFKAGEKTFAEGLFKKQEERNDFFKGFITKNKGLLKDKSRTAFYSKEMISYIEGYWIDYVMIDGDKYWELERDHPMPLIKHPKPLDSDSIFRTDLQTLLTGNLEEAQKQKEILEEIQRNDRKLREMAEKEKGKISGKEKSK